LPLRMNRRKYRNMSETPITEKKKDYQVLARKYRPQSFEGLIGQDALVRTLTNAIAGGRIAHAFMLTGVRGIGKTTTARIIAKALNYRGPDGTAEPTTGSTEDCPICRAISEDRHPDVLEMDAASRTGVDDIREILDGVRYAPTEARYKVYVIDEVHMLSKNAFNALLKTLEEPPEHVKFIFATTEIHKVPVTVLSRCQRFDLRRVDVPTLSAHYASICEQEDVAIEAEALTLISRAADGSVRDGLSLLDQAMAMIDKDGADGITTQLIKDMLGLADQGRALDVLESALTGNMPDALAGLDDLYANGADPVILMQDLLELTHQLTRQRAVPAAEDSKNAMAPDTLMRIADLAGKLSMPTLGRTWQLLLKGLAEVQAAPVPQAAAEMVIIRLAYAADLPDPADVLKKLESGETVSASGGVPVGGSSPSAATAPASTAGGNGGGNGGGAPVASLRSIPKPEPQPSAMTERALYSIEDIHKALEEAHELVLAGQVYLYVQPVKVQDGLLEIKLAEHAPQDLVQSLRAGLERVTGKRWVITLNEKGAAQPSLAQAEESRIQAERAQILQFPVIREILEVFPDAELTEIQNPKQ